MIDDWTNEFRDEFQNVRFTVESDESADLTDVTTNINSDLGTGQQADLEAYEALFYGIGLDGGTPLTPPLVHDFSYAVGMTASFTVVATHTNPQTAAVTTSRKIILRSSSSRSSSRKWTILPV